VDGSVVGQCGRGLLVLVAAHKNDTPAQANKLADKVVGLRIFNDAEGKMNLALKDLDSTGEAELLIISNFTLYGDALKSRRPSFVDSAGYDAGEALYNCFLAALKELNKNVQAGIFGADMKVELLNDGPVTLIIDV
jgi:D-tyrosyl-tRNA(Tyr) deacylase